MTDFERLKFSGFENNSNKDSVGKYVVQKENVTVENAFENYGKLNLKGENSVKKNNDIQKGSGKIDESFDNDVLTKNNEEMKPKDLHQEAEEKLKALRQKKHGKFMPLKRSATIQKLKNLNGKPILDVSKSEDVSKFRFGQQSNSSGNHKTD